MNLQPQYNSVVIDLAMQLPFNYHDIEWLYELLEKDSDLTLWGAQMASKASEGIVTAAYFALMKKQARFNVEHNAMCKRIQESRLKKRKAMNYFSDRLKKLGVKSNFGDFLDRLN